MTLRGEMLDDYSTVRRYIEGLNRLIVERGTAAVPIRLSDTEVIKMALACTAADILNEDDQSAKAGLKRMLAAE